MGIFANNTERKILQDKMRAAGRLPPGQSATLKWPVLHHATVPRFDPANWCFRTIGLIEWPLALNWGEFLALPQVEVTADFHCVTRWSRFDNRWKGVSFRTICNLTRPKPEAAHVLVHGSEGYTTNVPLVDLLESNVLLACQHDGVPLPAEHGGPLRLIVPKLYAWKSAKWVCDLEFMAQDRPGFWERNGYHRYGDPWKEQRHESD
jgi:DMSO/TMAO reductase YedYZ molybdopterin-dependent catalytic subunit